MILVRGRAGGTALTGTIYEPGEDPPTFSGSPDDGAAYTWVCDEFYEVETGGQRQQIDDRELQVAFESPLPRGFETRASALSAAESHLRTQFARLNVDPETVEIETESVSEAGPDGTRTEQ